MDAHIQSEWRLQADDEARIADLEGPDFFPTPEWATHALINNEEFEGTIWEPACGDGTMAEVLKQTGCPVEASDLYDRGYGESGIDIARQFGCPVVLPHPGVFPNGPGVASSECSRRCNALSSGAR